MDNTQEQMIDFDPITIGDIVRYQNILGALIRSRGEIWYGVVVDILNPSYIAVIEWFNGPSLPRGYIDLRQCVRVNKK